MDSSDTLESTNRLLLDLERKLSFVLTTSLNQTTQSHGSVVQNHAMSGLARHNIQLSVLQYIRDNGSEFDADLVYADRQQKFMTKFAREYSPSNGSTQASSTYTPVGTGSWPTKEVSLTLDEHEDLTSGADSSILTVSSLPTDKLAKAQEPLSKNGTVALAVPTANSAADAVSLGASLHDESEYASDTYDDYYDGEFDSEDDYNEDDFENNFNDFNTEPYNYEDEEEEEDMLLPPLPPRLPPREMDPDKLYGLYDFSGPDPLHCTLSRDEPVYLINDLDNYWWLIRKLSKAERMQLWNSRGSREDVTSDDEDGKVGFVPAECLETYGERLARLNCFKNEELEKSSRETLPLEYFKDGSGEFLATSQVDFEQPNTSKEMLATLDSIYNTEGSTQISAELGGQSHDHFNGSTDEIIQKINSVEVKSSSEALSLGRKGSILKKKRGYKQSNKLVTFENLGDISLDDDESDDVDFSDHYLHIGHEDIEQKHVGNEDFEKHSEVLSDVYPSGMPLQINKSTRKLASPVDNIGDEASIFVRPKALSVAETDSIGSFSPDTPPAGKFASSPRDEFVPSSVRRSRILERLSRVTSDIQEQLGGAGERELEFGGSLNHEFHDNEANSSVFADYMGGNHQINEEDDYDIGYELVYEEEQKPDGENDTPLTSMNSLNNLASSPKTPIQDKRKSKPIHDMFMPILGKLDELTEKLAELEQHLL